MTLTRTQLLGGAVAVVAGVALWILLVSLPGTPEEDAAPGSAQAAGEAGDVPTITATLYYVSEDGLSLVAVEREVPHAERASEQARRIVEAQLMPPPAPLVSPIPEGTTLRALYLTEQGEAFVDLSSEVTDGHPGGSLDELFTVYAVVNAVTTNISSISAVQILVGGRETDTLAGHVDLRHPLRQNLNWVQRPASNQTAALEER